MTASALLAGLVAIASPGHAHHHRCEKTYTVRMDTRAARAVYAGSRHVPRRDVRMLAKFVRCQRYRGARRFVRAYNARARRAWVTRVRASAAAAWSGPAIASWYDDSGTTGCGFHAGYGIATFVVACGGKVTLRHGSSTVTAVRDDSGPYVSGRTFDLDPAVKAALGCGDLCSVDWRAG